MLGHSNGLILCESISFEQFVMSGYTIISNGSDVFEDEINHRGQIRLIRKRL